MKKISFFLCMFLSVNMFAQSGVATFENEVGGINVAKADTCWQGADAPVAGWNNWKSGDYNFQTYFDNSYGVYYSAFTVTNETANTFASTADAYRSANGGAYAGQNFAVWNMNYYGADTVTFAAQTVPGFFVNNTAYAVTSMSYGDAYAKKFTQEDWFVLYCIGVKNGVAVDTVEVDLASEGTYIAAWTYVDLSELGEINGLTFSMNSSDASQWGMNTPAYFVMDNFGSQRPLDYEDPERAEFSTETTVENTNVAEKAVKALRNGQILIIRGEKVYTVTGQRLQ